MIPCFNHSSCLRVSFLRVSSLFFSSGTSSFLSHLGATIMMITAATTITITIAAKTTTRAKRVFLCCAISSSLGFEMCDGSSNVIFASSLVKLLNSTSLVIFLSTVHLNVRCIRSRDGGRTERLEGTTRMARTNDPKTINSTRQFILWITWPPHEKVR